MLYTPHTRVFLSAVPVFSGSSLSGFIEVEDAASAARAWLFAEREQRLAEAASARDVAPASSSLLRLLPFIRRQSTQAA
jgi:hypothetical protein